jgi:hypothetical protein
MSTDNPYQSPIEVSQPKPAGPQFAPCYKCGSTSATKVGYTFWGGVIGPRLLTHVKCSQCGTKYNGKSGKSNTPAIIIYSVVVFVIVMGAYVALRIH